MWMPLWTADATAAATAAAAADDPKPFSVGGDGDDDDIVGEEDGVADDEWLHSPAK